MRALLRRGILLGFEKKNLFFIYKFVVLVDWFLFLVLLLVILKDSQVVGYVLTFFAHRSSD